MGVWSLTTGVMQWMQEWPDAFERVGSVAMSDPDRGLAVTSGHRVIRCWNVKQPQLSGKKGDALFEPTAWASGYRAQRACHPLR